MADNNDLKVIVGLDLPKSLIEVEGDLKILKKMLDRTDGGKLKITAGLNLGKTIGNINTQIKQVEKSVNAIKLTPQLDVSNSQVNTQFSEQFERIKKTINFHDVALTIKKEMSLIKEAGGDVTKEIENQLAVISESFGKEPEKVKDAFDKIYSIFEQYSSLYRRSNQEKRKRLDGLNTTFLQDPNIVGADKNTVGANISKEWFKRIVSAFSNDEEAAKKAIRSIFGRVSIAAEDGLKTGLHQLDTLMKEYTDPLTKRKLNPEETFAAFYEAAQKAMTTFPDDTELQLDAIETAKKKIEQLINTNLHLVQVNQQVADSENQVAQAQHNVNDNQVSFNSDNDIDNIQKSIQLNEQLVTSNEKLNALKKERTELDEKIKQDEKEISDGVLFDTDTSQFEQSLKQNKDLLRSVEDSIASETANNEAIKNQIQTLTQQLEEEKKAVEQATSNLKTNVDNASYISNEEVKSKFKTLAEAKKYFEDLGVGKVSTVFNKGELQHITDFTVKVQGATGVVEKFRYAVENIGDDKNPIPEFHLKNINAANEGVLRLIEAQKALKAKIEETKIEYDRRLKEFISENSAIESGLTQPIQEFKDVLNGLGDTKSIEDVKNQFEKLKASAAEIAKYLDTTNSSFNKKTNAINNYKQMDSIIKNIELSYDNLVIKNEDLNKSVQDLRSHYTALVELKETEDGYTAKWAESYREVNIELKKVRNNIEAAVKAESSSREADRNSQYQIQQRHLKTIIEANKEIVKLTRQKLSADEAETAELDRQKKNAEQRVRDNKAYLVNNDLYAGVAKQIADSTKAMNEQLKLIGAKQIDNIKNDYQDMISVIDKAIEKLKSLQSKPLFKTSSKDEGVKALSDDISATIKNYENLKKSISGSKLIPRNVEHYAERLTEINQSTKELRPRFDELRLALTDSAKAEAEASKETKILSSNYQKMIAEAEKAIGELYKLKDNPSLNNKANSSISNGIDAEINKIAEDYAKLVDLLKYAPTNQGALKLFENKLRDITIRANEAKASVQQLTINTSADNKLSNEFKSLSTDIDKAISKLNSLNNSAIFRNHNTDSGVVQFKQELASLIEKYNQLKTALSSTPKTSDAFQQLQQQADALGVKLKQAKTRNDELQAGLRNADGATQLTARVQKLTAQIKEYMAVNTKAAKKYSAQFDNLLSGLSSAEINKDSVAVRNLTNEFQLLKSQIKSAGDTGLTLFERIKKDISKFSGWLSITTVVSTGVREIRKMVTNVIELDNSLLELSKVSDLTASGIKNVTDRAFELSKQVGKTGTDVINAVTNFKRAGFELEQSMDLAEKALVLTNVAEGIDDASTAATALISIMKGYGDTSAEFAQKILDAVNEVSNTQAIDFDSLIEGSQRLSAVAKQGGASFEQMLGILTGTNEVLQNIEKTSTGAITIFTRLQSIQLPDEEDVMPLAKLQETFSKNTGGIVNIVDQTTGQLRNVYDILNDISEVWDTLDKNTQEGLAFAAAGTRQKNVFLSMMENWENVKKSVESAANSVGSATEENQKYLDSISGRLKMVESNFQSLSQTIVNSDFVKFLVSAFGEFLGTIDNIISKFGVLQTLLPIVLGSLSAFKNVGRHKMSCLKMEYADCNVVVTRNELIA